MPTEGTDTTTTRTAPPTATGNLSRGVEITTAYDGPLAVVLTQRTDGRTTFARRFPAERQFIALHEEMRDHLAYDVTVRSGCTVLWSEVVPSYAAYRVRIDAAGDATVESVVEA